ncbi:MAG TPA: RNA polymerase sporulation sigma factor SigH [Solirubrobacterales bacterium]|nr:RNA polymerase sporulation sigma factor SigH [Solirubrobacterales bacterium]
MNLSFSLRRPPNRGASGEVTGATTVRSQRRRSVALSSPTQEFRLPTGRLNGSTRVDPNPQPELDDHYLVALAKDGRADAYDAIVRRYRGFVRLKASSYFLLGGESDDLIQEGLLGLYKAIRDYRSDRESSFRSFAELCITRQIITAVKTATRNKHTPLNQYVSFSQTPAAAGDSDTTLDEILPGPSVADPVNQVIASEELESLVSCLSGTSGVLSDLESRVLSLYLDGHSYEATADRLECDTKTVDNALQRVKRKVATHLATREVPA